MFRRLINKCRIFFIRMKYKNEHKKEWKKRYGNELKNIKNKYKKDGIYHDTIEKTKQYKECADEVDRLAEIQAGKDMFEYTGKEFGKGYCYIFWGCKKKILKEKYGLDWRSPAEMNPYCKFD